MIPVKNLSKLTCATLQYEENTVDKDDCLQMTKKFGNSGTETFLATEDQHLNVKTSICSGPGLTFLWSHYSTAQRHANIKTRTCTEHIKTCSVHTCECICITCAYPANVFPVCGKVVHHTQIFLVSFWIVFLFSSKNIIKQNNRVLPVANNYKEGSQMYLFLTRITTIYTLHR